MMINVSFAELFMPAATTSSEPMAKEDAAAEQEFAAFLAACFAPVSTPAVPELLPMSGTEMPGAKVEAMTAETGKLTEWVAPITAPSALGHPNATEAPDLPSAFSAFPALQDAAEFGAEPVKQAASVVKTIAAGQEIVGEKIMRDRREITFLSDASAQAVSVSLLSMQQAKTTQLEEIKYEDLPYKDTNPPIELLGKHPNLFSDMTSKEARFLDVSTGTEVNLQTESVMAIDNTTPAKEAAPILHVSTPTGSKDFSIERAVQTLGRSVEEIQNDEELAVGDKPNRLAHTIRAISSQTSDSATAPLIKPVAEATLSTASHRQGPAPPNFSAPEIQREPSSNESPKLSTLDLQPEPFSLEQPEKNILSAQDFSAPPIALPLQGTSASNPLAQAGIPNAGDTHPILSQTIQPMIELAQNTQPRETRTLHFSLHPAELGRVEVEITRDAVGHVSASLTAEHSEAANTLTHGIGQLRETLEQAGLTIERLEVTATPQLQHSAQGQAGNQQQSHSQYSTEADYLPLTQPSTDSAVADEEEKLLSLRA